MDDFNEKVWLVLRKLKNYYYQNNNNSLIKYSIQFFPQKYYILSSEEECENLKLLEQKKILRIVQRKINNYKCIRIDLILNHPQFNNLFQEYFFNYKSSKNNANSHKKQTVYPFNQNNKHFTNFTPYFIKQELKILDIILKHYLRNGAISNKDYRCLITINRILKKIIHETSNIRNEGYFKKNNIKDKFKNQDFKKSHNYDRKVQSTLDKNTRENTNPLPITGKIEVQGLSEGLKALRKYENQNIGPKFPFKIPSGTHWDNVIIRFLNDEEIEIHVKKLKHITNYKEMGMIGKGKIPVPNEQWIFLKVLAQCQGELSIKDPEAKDKYKKQKQALTETLRNYFSIDYDPFYPYKSCSEKDGNSYKIKILLIPSQPKEEPENSIEEDTDPLGIQEYLNTTMVGK